MEYIRLIGLLAQKTSSLARDDIFLMGFAALNPSYDTTILKTKAELFDALKGRVRELHKYEVSEIISIDISNGLPEYLAWIDSSTGSRPG